MTRVCLVFAGATVAIVAAAATFGPTALRLLYGPAYSAPASDLALLGVGAGCYLASATISQALLAVARASGGAVAWALSAALFVFVEVFSPGDDLRRVSLGIASAMVTSTVLLTLVFARRARGAPPKDDPGAACRSVTAISIEVVLDRAGRLARTGSTALQEGTSDTPRNTRGAGCLDLLSRGRWGRLVPRLEPQ